ncbi:MAG: spermidine/putrescine ABC transporter substrate-binding protein [Halolamina sp.]
MKKKNHSGRRRFLKRTGLAGTAALTGLAGCSGGGGGSTETAYPGNATRRENLGLPELDYDIEDSLNVFQWADYWPTGTVEKFEDAYDVSVNVSNYASNEEMFNKLKAGGSSQFDVIFPSDYMVSVLSSQDMIQPLNLDRIPHWDNLEQYWIDNAPYDPGEDRYSAPYFWGTSGVAWNENMFADSVKEELPFQSWEVMWDDRFSGDMTMLNDQRETIGAALKYLGYSLNTKDESKIEEAKEILIEQKKLLGTYDSVNMSENLINENFSPIHSWSGGAFSAYWELYSDGSSPINYQVPKEGSVVWVDTAAVTKDAKNPNAAHAFINFVLNAKVNAEIANYVYYPSPNEAAKEYMFESMLNNERIYPPEETFESLEFIKNVGDATQLYSEAWTEIQNA